MFAVRASGRLWAAAGLVFTVALLTAATLMIAWFAPTERTMGPVQRSLYLHVAVAWLGLGGFLAMAASGLAYLLRRDLRWDDWFQATGELGWLCGGLTLATGALWARHAWGTWWEWDPRLTASFLLWLIGCGILLVRRRLHDPHQRARTGAVWALLGTVDFPVVVMATRWFRGMHPVSPRMEPAMRLTLLVTVAAFTAMAVAWTLYRRRQLQWRRQRERRTQAARVSPVRGGRPVRVSVSWCEAGPKKTPARWLAACSTMATGAALLLAVSLALADADDTGPGVIRGVVLNSTHGRAVGAGTEVVLRRIVAGQSELAGETLTDAEGRFQFTGLRVGRSHVYLPGANRDDVHYPGTRLQLTALQPEATVQLAVCDAVASPNPLVVERQEILIQAETGVLRVTETMVIRNPTRTTYVGEAVAADQPPVTLALAIPREFERTTFHQEFYGRNFAVREGRVVTEIPWTPGERELKFTYTLRNEDRHRTWARPLDLPCAQLRVRVQHGQPDEVSCSLGRGTAASTGELVFESAGRPLPAGQVIRVALGRLPISWTTYARWAAAVALIGLVAGVGVRLGRKLPACVGRDEAEGQQDAHPTA